MTARAAITLANVLEGAPGLRVRLRVGPDDRSPMISSVTSDSRHVRPGALFCCVPGAHADGHDFAAGAVGDGAVAVVVGHELPVEVTQVVVADVRAAVGPLAASFHGHPSSSTTVVGVTGTNGKTTTTALLASIFEAAGRHCGVLGTLTGRFTTPEAPELQERLAGFVADGASAVAMEVSSHALEFHRVDGTHFAAAIFTNLKRDHLDLHGSEEAYFLAKARLFTPELSALGVIDADDPHGRRLLEGGSIPMVAFSLDDVDELAVSARSSRFRWRGRRYFLNLGGRFNVSNALGAAVAADALGIDADAIEAGLASVPQVPGRFEVVTSSEPFTVVVDFAHTPDGLAKVLSTARDATTVPGASSSAPGRVVVVFGCGGDRDATKRPLMGEVATELADEVIVTSDNPRSEDPAAIISAVMSGIAPNRRSRVTVEADRRAAIALALGRAGAGDVVVVAGKGHEATQTIGDVAVPFDDRTVVRELLGRPS